MGRKRYRDHGPRMNQSGLMFTTIGKAVTAVRVVASISGAPMFINHREGSDSSTGLPAGKPGRQERRRFDDMAAYGLPDNPGVTTHSRLRAWWLQSLWGYEIVEVRRAPRSGYFGNLVYDETYLMSPRN